MDTRVSPQISLFEKVLRAFDTGGFTYTDLLEELKRLLSKGASPTDLMEILRRRELIEPLPDYAHAEVLALLQDALDHGPAAAPSEHLPDTDEDLEAAALLAAVRARTQLPSLTPASEADRSAEAKVGGENPDHAQSGQASVADLGQVREELRRELAKAREVAKASSEKIAAADAARIRSDSALRESQRRENESRNSLSAQSASIAELQRSIAERNARIAALEREQASTLSGSAQGANKLSQGAMDLEAAQASAALLAAELANVRAALSEEQNKARSLSKALAEKVDSRDSVGSRREEASDAGRWEAEARTLRNLVAARDAQIAALGQDLAKTQPALDARIRAGAQLEVDLQSALARATTLAADLTAARTELASEQRKNREISQSLQEHGAAVEAASKQREELARESERHQAEWRTLRDSLVTRDAELEALRHEHRKVLETSDARAKRATQLESDLRASRARHDAVSLQVKEAQEAGKTLEMQLRSGEFARSAVQAELDALKIQSKTYLEELETREWRRGFDQVASGELDRNAMHAERDALRASVARLQGRLDGQTAAPAHRSAEYGTLGPALTDATALPAGIVAAPKPRSWRNPWGSAAKARALRWAAAVCIISAVAWSITHHSSAPGPAPIEPGAAMFRPGKVIRDCPTCPSMTVLPTGRFMQGAAEDLSGAGPFEKPLHPVAMLHEFAMATSPVTVDEFNQFASATGRNMQGCETYDGEWKYQATNSWRSPGFTQTRMHPVTCVSWDDAEAYAQWLSRKTGHRYRLPSASEWEYAARAGGSAGQPWNSEGSGACAYANVADASAARRYPGWSVFGCDDGYVHTSPVGTFKRSSFGLNDMLGNVLQWTEDCWHADYRGAPSDGTAWSDGQCGEHELRGGSWFSSPAFVRASYRNHFAAD